MSEETTKKMTKKNYFTELYGINVQDKVERKGQLSYLSWPFAWAELKKKHPDATYTIYENDLGWNYHTDGRTCWVKTGVTVEGIEHIEMLPVMDFKNKSIPAEAVTSFDVNKAIQRSLTKAVARHGLGLYIYAGEDLPEAEEKEAIEKAAKEMGLTNDDKKRAKLKKLLMDTDSDVTLFLIWCNKEFKKEIDSVDALSGTDLDRAIKKVEQKEKK